MQVASLTGTPHRAPRPHVCAAASHSALCLCQLHGARQASHLPGRCPNLLPACWKGLLAGNSEPGWVQTAFAPKSDSLFGRGSLLAGRGVDEAEDIWVLVILPRACCAPSSSREDIWMPLSPLL